MDDAGTNPAPLTNDRIPLRQSAISELMGSGKDIIKKTEKLEEHADKLLVTLNTLLNAENSQKINRLIDNMERSTAALEPLLRSSQHTSEKMSKLVDEIQPNQISTTLEAIRQAATSAKETADTARPTLVQVQKSMTELEQVSHRIEQVTADLGENLNYETLPRIHELAHQLNRDAKSLNRLMETLEEDPQSAIFGKAIAKPGPGEKGFQP
jgi:phospholipid/cholesterol/gamma-HCH transport system substrate-binding protein